MGLTAGTRLGHFEITGHLGTGGMGEVYRARDTILGREVAIKVLPENIARDQDRVERFEREAKMLAALDHPNIGALYEFRNENGLRFLALQLVEGESLKDRLDRGPLPVSEALPLFRQIAAALEAAHEKGIVHRDLKPGNVQLGQDGMVKVLDFGLARPMFAAARPPLTPVDPTRMHEPTHVTAEGSILGTPSYMSPEQARGKDIDLRSDVWAFGCCLYEALTGRRPFQGDTITDTLAKIVEHDPDWSCLPDSTPPPITSLIRRCLEKDPRRRIRHGGDVSIILEDAQDSLQQKDRIPIGRRQRRPVVLRSIVVIAVVLLVGYWMWSRLNAQPPAAVNLELITPAEPIKVKRFPINLPTPISPPEVSDTPLALSPDGTLLAYKALTPEGERLALLQMGELDPVIVPGSNRADRPFFSSDGQWVGFVGRHDGWHITKAPVAGGPSIRLVKVPRNLPAAWGEDGFIYYTPSFDSPILRIPAAGGEPEPVTTLEAGEGTHTLPILLPGGRGLVYSSFVEPRVDACQIKVLDFRTGKSRNLFEEAGALFYLPTGHLVYTQVGGLMAVRFDLDTMEPKGPSFDVTDPRMVESDEAPTRMTTSASGTAVYVPSELDPADALQLVWLDLRGRETPLDLPPAIYGSAGISPDGRLMAIAISDSGNYDLWLIDLARGTNSRLTDDPNKDQSPLWTPDGKSVIFLSNRSGRWGLYRKSIDGDGEVTKLLDDPTKYPTPQCVTPDGSVLVYGLGEDLNSLTLDGNGSVRPLVNTRFSEGTAALSPDDKWIAYASDETGRYEVYLQSFPEMGPRVQISTDSGVYPHWVGGDSSRLRFFQFEPSVRLMEAEMQFEPVVSMGEPRMLCEWGSEYNGQAIDPAGDRYLATRPLAGNVTRVGGTEVVVVENWFEEVKRREHRETPMAEVGN